MNSHYIIYITAATSFKHVVLINSLFHPSSRYKYGAVVIVNSKEPFTMILRRSWLINACFHLALKVCSSVR